MKKISIEAAKTRVEKLKKSIEEYRYAYHVLNRNVISPDALDSLKKELFDLEQEYPQLVTPDSPTQRIGGEPLKEFRKVAHETPMLSFNDAFSAEDMQNWLDRNLKIAPAAGKEFYGELKIDGLAISLLYEDGVFITGSTRGNGRVGEDVTQNLKTVEAIPLKLFPLEVIRANLEKEGLARAAQHFTEGYPRRIEVRGEVFLNVKDFDALNRAQRKAGGAEYANPRNVAAGSVRQLDPKITASRNLDSFAYSLVTPLGQETHEGEHRILTCLGFKTNPHNKLLRAFDEITAFREHWGTHRAELPYEIDGTVIITNDNTTFRTLGVVGKAPRGAIAFKFSPKQATTIVEDIQVQVGRTGTLTPVAHLKPVDIGGVTVSRASLHNLDEIGRLGVKIGDTVIVERAGDVIPQVVRVLTELRTGKEREFRMPKRCPACGSAVERAGVYYRCVNKGCYALSREKLYHFVSRPAFDIVGLGPKNIDRFIEEGFIRDSADLFTLKSGDIAALERFGEKSAQHIIDGIQKRKQITLPRFLYALGVLHVGEENAKLIAAHLSARGTMHTPAELGAVAGKLHEEEWQNVGGVGAVVSQSLAAWFAQKENQALLRKLTDAGVRLTEERKGRLLTGMTFVFTGELSAMSRENAKELAESLGGQTAEAVSKKVTHMVAGENPGSKLEKAKKLGIQVLSEQEFLKLTRRG